MQPSLSRLSKNIQDKKVYESLVETRDIQYENVRAALDMVRDYIRSQKLILVGGLAIDMSMRAKGSQLYPDGTLPDYDFYSPRHHYDAYKIAEMLHKKGMPDVSVINAMHPSTMRVRVNFQVVADVTYVPHSLFDIVPYVMFDNIRVVHPHYQMIDQHSSLSFPYVNAPWETIRNRWEKDATRYDLLHNLYPITRVLNVSTGASSSPVGDELKKIDAVHLTLRWRDYPMELVEGQCLSGFAGIAYWLQEAKTLGYKPSEIVRKMGNPDTGGMKFLRDDFVVRRTGKKEVRNLMRAAFPVDSHGITFYTNDLMKMRMAIASAYGVKGKALTDSSQVRWYNRFLDKLPHKVIIANDWELLDNDGILLSAHKTSREVNGVTYTFHVANLQNILMYMLTNFILLKGMKKLSRGKSFHVGYLIGQDIVRWAVKKWKGTTTSNRTKFEKFLPSPHVYGETNMSDSLINYLYNEKHGTKKGVRQPRPVYHTDMDKHKGKVPAEYYKFDPLTSPVFAFDGQPAEKYIARVEV